MKSIQSLLLCFMILVLISSCKSEEERRMSRMIDSLDSAWTIHAEGATSFFNSVDAMKKAVKPTRILNSDEESQLKGDAARAWTELKNNHLGGVIPGSKGKLSTDEALVMGQNAFSILYDDSLWNASSYAFFKTLNGLPTTHLSHLYDHMHEGKWSDLFYRESLVAINMEERPEYRDNSLKLMPQLETIRYLLVIQPVLEVPSEVIQSSFKGGKVLANVLLWDIAEQKFQGSFWMSATNSFSITTITFSKKSEKKAIEGELKLDLRRNMHIRLQKQLSSVIEGAASSK